MPGERLLLTSVRPYDQATDYTSAAAILDALAVGDSGFLAGYHAYVAVSTTSAEVVGVIIFKAVRKSSNRHLGRVTIPAVAVRSDWQGSCGVGQH